MAEHESRVLGDVLEAAHFEIAAGRLPEGHTDEVELHAPSRRWHRESVKIDPEAEVVLRERFGPDVDSNPG